MKALLVILSLIILSVPALTAVDDTKKEAERYFAEYKSKYHARISTKPDASWKPQLRSPRTNRFICMSLRNFRVRGSRPATRRP